VTCLIRRNHFQDFDETLLLTRRLLPVAPHIVLKESGLTFEVIAAPTKTHKLADGTDYYTINPLGYVPLLVQGDGRQLREGPAIVQYLADLVPDKQLAPANGSWERYKLQEWLNTISTELHKGFSPLFTPNMPAEAKDIAKTRLISRLSWVNLKFLPLKVEFSQ
jgi:glutathione S-transferase